VCGAYTAFCSPYPAVIGEAVRPPVSQPFRSSRLEDQLENYVLEHR
jgi:hypothetical protein